ncbi:hypothetical protein P154DRAFT_451550 [Amniculicola lignicola CBS 123094]|uniref:P-loop containing nucleoside triphosphate hydrolase protein n=1 Tax=Amniculicola lignicola CBS 123094 TaxID=1392246 RepID=A0A6A5VSY9_9PLEO|nr:hypothetical protein P154DRAFT_451550 [Amniculicola lignicola CBS 123094]
MQKLRHKNTAKGVSIRTGSNIGLTSESRVHNTSSEAHLKHPSSGQDVQSLPEGLAEVNDEDEEDKKAAQEFKKAKKHYNDLRQKNGGHLTFQQDVEWMRVQSAEDARLRKRQIDIQMAIEEEVALFPVNGGPASLDIEEYPISESEEFEEVNYGPNPAPFKRKRPALPRKEPIPVSMQDAELESMRVALEAEADKPKRKKKKKGENGQQIEHCHIRSIGASTRTQHVKAKSAKAPKSKSSGSKSTKTPRRTAKDKKLGEQAHRQIGSLFNSDVFTQQASQDAAEQPTFQSKTKQDALKELIASVPLEDKKTAKSDMAVLLAATKDFNGRGAVKALNGLWLVKGMRTALKPYQVLGSAFMRRRERAAEQPRGGLMADQMGLGKTLMMLANIINGRAPKDSTIKTTLIVASPSLLTQWESEIERHTDGSLEILRYGTGSRIKSSQSFHILGIHDIVLTTYSEVMGSYPKNNPPIHCETAQQKIDWWKGVWEKSRGVLHRMHFHRVVLDEAQAIKNHTSRTSIACRALIADHRWAISGTPIMNSLQELYPYFKFLGVPHTGTLKIFNKNYCDKGNFDSAERLLVRLNGFMIRRTHSDRMFGAPILKLPKADQITHWCEFNAVERNVYDIVERRFAARIVDLAQCDELDKSYSCVLVMLLRLRQLTAHILMLQFVMRDLLEQEDIERIREVVDQAASKEDDSSTIVAIRSQLKALADEEKKRTVAAAQEEEESQTPLEAELNEEFECHDPGTSDGQNGSCGTSGKAFGKAYDFKPYMKSLTTGESWKKAKDKAKCVVCDNKPKKPWLTSCKHLICQSCYEELSVNAAEDGEDRASCRQCREIFTYAHPCEAEDESENSPGPQTRSKSKKPGPENEDLKASWLTFDGDTVLPSAKTVAIKAQIMNWIHENPKVKIIIYTQFRAMIRIMAKVCEEEGWQFEQYHGGMSFAARDKAISTFADEEKNCQVFLASLKCGGLGLNLTMASRVIIIDPWWNSYTEQQAFCRVFRIGQTDTTFMSRFCVRNTVDQRIMEMQERKQEEIDEIMNDDGAKFKKLDDKDLLRLFGAIDMDEDGRPFIITNDSDSRGGFHADADHEGYADEV